MERQNLNYLAAAAVGAVIAVQTGILPNPLHQGQTNPKPPAPVSTPAPAAPCSNMVLTIACQPSAPQPPTSAPTAPAPVPPAPPPTQVPPAPPPGSGGTAPAPVSPPSSGSTAPADATSARQTLVQAVRQVLAPCVQAASALIQDGKQGSTLPAQTPQDAQAAQQACSTALSQLQSLPLPSGLQNDPTAQRLLVDAQHIAALLADFGAQVQSGLQQGFSQAVVARINADLKSANSANQDTVQIIQSWGLH